MMNTRVICRYNWVVFYLIQHIQNVILSTCNQKKTHSWAIFPFFISHKVFKIWVCFILTTHLSLASQTSCDQFLNTWLVATVVDSIALSILVSFKEVQCQAYPILQMRTSRHRWVNVTWLRSPARKQRRDEQGSLSPKHSMASQISCQNQVP